MSQILGAVEVPADDSVRDWVRRVHRPRADSFELSALIRGDPGDLVVFFGFENDAGSSSPVTRFKIYGNGSPTSVCAPVFPALVYSPTSRPIVKSTGSGLDVYVDLVQCPSMWSAAAAERASGPRHWFLEVENRGSQEAWIEVTQVLSRGRSLVHQVDSDRDGRSDGAEDDLILDLLGYDQDQDGLHEDHDPDDAVPSWMPALRLFSDDYSSTATFSFLDQAAPITSVRVDGVYQDGRREELALVRDGASWTTRMNQRVASLPVDLEVQWTDAYGTTGSVVVGMTGQGSNYAPSDVDCEAVDGTTGESITFNQAFSEVASSGGILLMAVPVVPGPVDDVVVVGGMAIRALYVQRAAAVAGLAAVGLSATGTVIESHRTPTDLPAGQFVVLGAAGAEFLFTQDQLDAFAGAGLTETELRNALENVVVHIDGGGGVTRWVYEVGSRLYFITSTADGVANRVQDAWEYGLPSSVNWGNGLSIQEVLLLERLMMLSLGASLADMLAEMPAHAHQRKGETCNVPIIIEPFDARDNVAPPLEGSIPELEVPCAAWGAYVDAMETVQTAADAFSQQRATDAFIGNTAFDYNHDLANKGAFPDMLHWYWDNGSTEVTCPSTGTVPQVRRCLPEDTTLRVDSIPFDTMELDLEKKKIVMEDVLDYNYLDFKDGTTPKYRDALSAKGTVTTAVGFANQEGKDIIQFFEDQMNFLASPLPASARDADVKIPYVITDKTGGIALVNIDEV